MTLTVSRFDWSDAGIGFGAAIGLALLSLAMRIGIRRHAKPRLSLRNVRA